MYVNRLEEKTAFSETRATLHFYKLFLSCDIMKCSGDSVNKSAQIFGNEQTLKKYQEELKANVLSLVAW
jgi:hypothetical protein